MKQMTGMVREDDDKNNNNDIQVVQLGWVYSFGTMMIHTFRNEAPIKNKIVLVPRTWQYIQISIIQNIQNILHMNTHIYTQTYIFTNLQSHLYF